MCCGQQVLTTESEEARVKSESGGGVLKKDTASREIEEREGALGRHDPKTRGGSATVRGELGRQ